MVYLWQQWGVSLWHYGPISSGSKERDKASTCHPFKGLDNDLKPLYSNQVMWVVHDGHGCHFCITKAHVSTDML